jgi:hypothetical protein
VFSDVFRGDLRSPRTTSLGTSKALGMNPEDGNIMSKHVGTTW